jgi:hypothetical protein
MIACGKVKLVFCTAQHYSITYLQPRRRMSQEGLIGGLVDHIPRTSQTLASFFFLAGLKEWSYTACVAPTASSILCGLRWSPFPRPLKCDRLASTRAIIPYQLDICVFVQVWIGMEFQGYQVIHLASRRG